MTARHLAWLAVLLAAAVTLSPWGGAAIGLVLGLLIAFTLGNPWASRSGPWARHLLAIAIVCLGAGMDLWQVLRVGMQGMGYTAIGIALTFALGLWLAHLLKVQRRLSLLLLSGTAICGGSAIAAVAPVLRAEDGEIAVAMACVFVLNAVALLLFPPLGQWLGLDPNGFGLWAALAIHDTSSVVGAAAQYPPPALEVATAAKLARALWIAPLALVLAQVAVPSSAEGSTPRISIPWFIPGFLGAATLMAVWPQLQPWGRDLAGLGKHGLALALLLIGLNLKPATLRAVGLRPLLLAVWVWVLVAGLTVSAILLGLIH